MTGHEVIVGRYALRGVLGRGGMAEVRDGWDTTLTRHVAVKLLHPPLRAQPHIRRRFEDEARAAARLSHPNIVAVFDFGEHDGNPFIVLERLPGQTLAHLIASGPMPPHHVRSMLDDVLAGLGAAHRAGMLHRDIKPGNILVSAAGDSVKVADFGIAKTAAATHTATGHVVGTMSYLSPQRLAGDPASVGDDLYAVGLMAYEALLGRPAFPQDDPAALAGAIMNRALPPVTDFRRDVDPVLLAVIDRATSRNPMQRFTSAHQMRAALAGDRLALTGGPGGPVPAATVARPPTKVLAPEARPRRARSARAFVIAAVAVVALIVSALAVAIDPSPSVPPEPAATSTSVAPPPVVAPSPQVQQSQPYPPPPPPGPGRNHGPGKPDKKHP